MNPIENLERINEVAGAFSRVFSCPDGQLALNHLCERFFVNDTTLHLVDGRLDTSMTAAQEGQRFVVLYIRDLVNFNLSAAESVLNSMRPPAPPLKRARARRTKNPA